MAPACAEYHPERRDTVGGLQEGPPALRVAARSCRRLPTLVQGREQLIERHAGGGRRLLQREMGAAAVVDALVFQHFERRRIAPRHVGDDITGLDVAIDWYRRRLASMTATFVSHGVPPLARTVSEAAAGGYDRRHRPAGKVTPSSARHLSD